MGRSIAMQETLRQLAIVPPAAGVTLVGESGSGRDWIARAIHVLTDSKYDNSGERLLSETMCGVGDERPFIGFDCADRQGLEERLFGAPGANAEPAATELERVLSGSSLHLALGGTLLLRHLPEIPVRVQARLARVLRRGEVRVIDEDGSERIAVVAVRPIATTAQPLDEEVIPELQRRVSHVTITVPALRERREDIPGLARTFLANLCAEAGVPPKAVSRQAVELLSALPWRGNLTELEAVMRTLAQVPGRQVRLSHVLECVRLDGQAAISTYTGTLKEARECFERDYVAAVLNRHRGRMAEAARTLGVQRTNLYRKVRQLSVARRSPGRHLS
jgi:DNA-binding NtrC family response regulator